MRLSDLLQGHMQLVLLCPRSMAKVRENLTCTTFCQARCQALKHEPAEMGSKIRPYSHVLHGEHGLGEDTVLPVHTARRMLPGLIDVRVPGSSAVLWGAKGPGAVPKEITNRKTAGAGGLSCFSFGRIENAPPWHCPQHPLKHPCSVSFPGLPHLPFHLFLRLLSLLLQPGSAFQPLSCRADRWALPSAWLWAQLPASTVGTVTSWPTAQGPTGA